MVETTACILAGVYKFVRGQIGGSIVVFVVVINYEIFKKQTNNLIKKIFKKI